MKIVFHNVERVVISTECEKVHGEGEKKGIKKS